MTIILASRSVGLSRLLLRQSRQLTHGVQALFPNATEINLKQEVTSNDPDGALSSQHAIEDPAAAHGEHKPHGTHHLSVIGAAHIPGGAFPHPKHSAAEHDIESAGMPPVSGEHASALHSASPGGYSDAVPFGASDAPQDADVGSFRYSMKKDEGHEAELARKFRKYSTWSAATDGAAGVADWIMPVPKCACGMCKPGAANHSTVAVAKVPALSTLARMFSSAKERCYESDVSANVTVKKGVVDGGVAVGVAGPAEAADKPNFNPYDGSASPEDREAKGYPISDNAQSQPVNTAGDSGMPIGGDSSYVAHDLNVPGGDTDRVVDRPNQEGDPMLHNKMSQSGAEVQDRHEPHAHISDQPPITPEGNLRGRALPKEATNTPPLEGGDNPPSASFPA